MSDDVKLPSSVQFLLLRGRAIEAYSTLEYYLCRLLADFSGMTREVASVVFYKVTSTRSRNEILDKLLRKKHGATCRLYWNSVLKEISKIDERRNQIVHWVTIAAPAEDGPDAGRTMLPGASIFAPPDVPLDANAGTPKIDRDDLFEFVIRTEFFARSLEALGRFLRPPLFRGQPDLEQLAAWREIFQQPATYPPPSSHPLFQTYSEQQSQRLALQASREAPPPEPKE
jgi:hypothetical protein